MGYRLDDDDADALPQAAAVALTTPMQPKGSS
jgi:hypothetical protein